jgi:hypothetical protein
LTVHGLDIAMRMAEKSIYRFIITTWSLAAIRMPKENFRRNVAAVLWFADGRKTSVKDLLTLVELPTCACKPGAGSPSGRGPAGQALTMHLAA